MGYTYDLVTPEGLLQMNSYYYLTLSQLPTRNGSERTNEHGAITIPILRYEEHLTLKNMIMVIFPKGKNCYQRKDS